MTNGCSILSFLVTTSLCEDCAICAPVALLTSGNGFFSAFARIVGKCGLQFIMEHHEHNRGKKCVLRAVCAVVYGVCCMLYVLSCEHHVSRPMNRREDELHKPLGYIRSWYSKLRRKRLSKKCVSIREPSVWKCSPPGTPFQRNPQFLPPSSHP